MQVNIYGLYVGDEEVFRTYPGNNWVINDWYQFCGWVKPSKIFNLHRYPHTHPSESRFIGDWKSVYNKADVDVVAVEPIDGVDRCVALDTETLYSMTSKGSLSCSISTMIWQAIADHATTIRILGVKLTDTEYEYQIAGILNAIEAAEDNGILVQILPSGRLQEWRSRDVPWKDLNDFQYSYWDNPVSQVTVTSEMLPDIVR